MRFLKILVVLLCLLPATALAKTAAPFSEDQNIVNPLLYGANCTNATLDAAQTAIGSNEAVLLLTRQDRAGANCTWTISANFTLASNITLRVPHGSRLDINNGVTMTACIMADRYQVAQGAGTLIPHPRCRADLPIEWYGAVPDGSTDNDAAFERAIRAVCSAGGVLTFSPGVYAYASTSQGVNIQGCNKVTLDGNGATIQVTGGSKTPIFVFLNSNDSVVRGFHFIGNNVPSGSCGTPDLGQNGSAVYFSNLGASGLMRGIRVHDNTMHDFAGNGVIFVVTVASAGIEEIYTYRNKLSGGSASCITSASINAQMIYFLTAATGGTIRKAWIHQNEIEASSRQGGIILQNNLAVIEEAHIYNNRVLNTGQFYAGSVPQNTYGIALYGPVNKSRVDDNEVTNAYTTGIYAISMAQTTFNGNLVTGTTETQDPTLNRGGMVVAQGQEVTVSDNILRDNNPVNIALQVGTGADRWGTVTGNQTVGTTGISLRCGTTGDGVTIASNNIQNAVNGLDLCRQGPASNVLSNVTIIGNTISATFPIGTSSSSGSGVGNAVNLSIIGNTLLTINNGLYGIRYRGTVQQASIMNNQVFGGNTACIDVEDATQINLTGNMLIGCGSGAGTGALATLRTQGQCWGNQIVALAGGSTTVIDNGGQEDLCWDTPTFASWPGTLVQNLGTIAGGSIGWVYDGAWKTWGTVAP